MAEGKFPLILAERHHLLDVYPVQQAGGREHLEYCMLAEDLAAFNAAIVGSLEVVSEFR